MKLVRQNEKVVPLRRRKPTVQRILKDTLDRNEFTKVMVVGMDRDGYLSHCYSDMRLTEAVGMAEYLKTAVMDRLFDES